MDSVTMAEDLAIAVAVSPEFASDGLCFAARASGFYRSDDGGLSWTDAYAGAEERPITTAIAFSPGFADDRRLFAGVAGGVMRSEDGGVTWEPAPFVSPPPVVATLAISAGGVLLAGTVEDGVFRSTDGGRSWRSANAGLLDYGILTVALSPAFADDGIAFAGTESGLFLSRTGGRSWRALDVFDDLAPVLSVAFVTAGAILVGTAETGLYRSDDVGATWDRVAEQSIESEVSDILWSAADGLALSGEGIFTSSDRGCTWHPWPVDLPSGTDTLAAAPVDWHDPRVGLLAALSDGSIRRLP